MKKRDHLASPVRPHGGHFLARKERGTGFRVPPFTHRVREFWPEVQLEEPEGNDWHDADHSGQGDGEPHRWLGQRVLGIAWHEGEKYGIGNEDALFKKHPRSFPRMHYCPCPAIGILPGCIAPGQVQRVLDLQRFRLVTEVTSA